MRILGLSGSLREDSLNTRLLAGARSLLPSGAELVVFEGLAAVPYYSEDDELPTPAAVADLASAVAEANAVLIATPEYNGSIPGHLKNALDWISRPSAGTPLRGTPAAVIGASTGLFGAIWAQAEMRKVLSTMGARVVDRELPIGQAEDALGPDGLPLERDAVLELSALLTELAELAQPIREAA